MLREAAHHALMFFFYREIFWLGRCRIGHVTRTTTKDARKEAQCPLPTRLAVVSSYVNILRSISASSAGCVRGLRCCGTIFIRLLLRAINDLSSVSAPLFSPVRSEIRYYSARRRQGNTNHVSAAASRQTPASSAIVSDTPICSAKKPEIKPPIGAKPNRRNEYIPMTRPRR